MKVRRDERTGAVVFEYEEEDLRENLGWRVVRLEKKIEKLEREIEDLKKLVRMRGEFNILEGGKK